jgi:hypothetical protein
MKRWQLRGESLGCRRSALTLGRAITRAGVSGSLRACTLVASEKATPTARWTNRVGGSRSVCSEGRIIAVRAFAEVPVEFNEVATVEVNHRRWDFRKWSDARA